MIRASNREAVITRKARVERTPEEKWEMVLKGLRSGNVTETCRRYGIALNLYYRRKDEAQQGATATLGGKGAAAVETEKDRRSRQLERSLGRKTLEKRLPNMRYESYEGWPLDSVTGFLPSPLRPRWTAWPIRQSAF